MEPMSSFSAQEAEQLVQQYPELEASILAILNQMADLPPPEQEATVSAFKRYIREGQDNSYSSNTQSLVEFIQRNNLLEETGTLFDLGAGPGDFLKALEQAYPEAFLFGVDLSPGFVSRFNQTRSRTSRVLMQMGLIDMPSCAVSRSTESPNAISILTLDRLARPKMLVQNMAQFTGNKILATLLPIVGRDDNPSLQGDPAIYTPEENKIVPGEDAQEDREVLTQYLEATWETDIAFEEVPYEVGSSGDVQPYNLGVFFTP